ncbi:MAG: C39 family peptidase [Brevinematales bacterium]|nr:C39 family peptidase [Brevinematales bacterium]
MFIFLCVGLTLATTKCGGTTSKPTYDTKTLNITYYYQSTANTCQSACIRMYLDYRYTKKGFIWDPNQAKRVPDESTVYNKIPQPRTMENICWTLNYFLWMGGYNYSYTSLYTYSSENALLRHQKLCVDKDEPVLVLFGKSSPIKNYHNVIMYGYSIKKGSSEISDIDKIYYHDPWEGSGQEVKKTRWDLYTSLKDDKDYNRYSISKSGI